MRNAENELLKFITCGSVDDGKSTLIGHILYASKLIYTDQEQALILDSQVGSRGGKIDYSLLLDGLMAEREQGITIDVAYRYFTSDARSFIVADTPGHEEYTRNMAVGASFADLAVILIDASQGVLVQTRRHARICSLMGIKNFVFAINKMDLVGYERSVVEIITKDIDKLSEELTLKNIYIIPVSATEGDNITKPSKNMPWFCGETLLSYLETVDIESTEEIGFYMPVQRVCRPDHTFRGFQGQIEAGKVSVSDTLTALPSGETAIVKTLYIGDRQAEYAEAGQPVTIQLDREVDVSRGCVLLRGAQLKTEKSFFATLLWMDESPLIPGREYWLKIGTKLIPAIVTGIRYKTDVNSGEKLMAESIGKNEIVVCEIVASESLTIDAFTRHKTAGELILIDRVTHATSACGVVEEVCEETGGNVLLRDGERELAVGLFDCFYYHPELHTVLRHSPNPATYKKGDRLPLDSAGFGYPQDFDISAGDVYGNIRKGAFAGFGKRNTEVPLIDANGLEAESTPPRSFLKYRTVAIWEKDYEI
ncbi:sulfate adenylyltransferase subunit 1 [Ruminiclostridium sufflavum DSM 19573]|uniref:sulfate adenylyltransferase n=1 Tax=Ruminiclostridium sufflavum DSM 19573 TaxID=1121337 RepID=A0A318XSD9_9FIRM|nr:GTP-binding protein [Ruminiclostridium sufflavum]PYG84864.1 sulfate adenylyltransferase subunit 1 [Ruminiclostridium sufflavum DSM 19573]